MKIFISPRQYPFLKDFTKKERTVFIKQVVAENKKIQYIFYIYILLSLVISGVIFFGVRPFIPFKFWPILGGMSFGIIWYLFLIYMNSTSVYKASKSIYLKGKSNSNNGSLVQTDIR